MNVIGEGYDDEKTLIGYILMDYEDGVPGVYMDTAEHKFNNNGAGSRPGTSSSTMSWAWMRPINRAT